jgi:hypothetical protein
MNIPKDNTVYGMALAAITTLGMAQPLAAADRWQERMLFDPPPSQLAAEQRGRIMIYDGMTEAQVARAMDSQFDRIDSMMFVRTIHTDERGAIARDPETGTVETDDDGC